MASPWPGGLAIAEPIPVTEALDEEVHEHRLEIRDPADRSIITVIELLSPTNKTPGSRGRESFIQKRREVYVPMAHWIEIELLRCGVRTQNRSPSAGTEYQAYLSRHDPRRERRFGSLWPIPLAQRLPIIAVPLGPGGADVPLDLQAALDQVYERGGYDLDFDYVDDPQPPLTPDALAWCRARIAAHHSSSESSA